MSSEKPSSTLDMGENRFEIGKRHFDSQEYFEAHEVWEDQWNEESGTRHAFYQALIQVAVALHHAGNDNFKGARKLFASSLGYIEKTGDDHAPVDFEKLKDCVLDFEIAIQKKLAGEEIQLPFF